MRHFQALTMPSCGPEDTVRAGPSSQHHSEAQKCTAVQPLLTPRVPLPQSRSDGCVRGGPRRSLGLTVTRGSTEPPGTLGQLTSSREPSEDGYEDTHVIDEDNSLVNGPPIDKQVNLHRHPRPERRLPIREVSRVAWAGHTAPVTMERMMDGALPQVCCSAYSMLIASIPRISNPPLSYSPQLNKSLAQVYMLRAKGEK